MAKECEKLAGCPFFHDKLPNMPTMVESLKRMYCLGDNSKCARHLVSGAGKPVPTDLFPNHRHRVAGLIGGGKAA